MNLINQLNKEAVAFAGVRKAIMRNVKSVDDGALKINKTVSFKGSKGNRGLKFIPDPKFTRELNTTWPRSKLDKNLGEKATNRLYGKGRDIKKYVKENKSPIGAAAATGAAIGAGGAYAVGKSLQKKEASGKVKGQSAKGYGKMKGYEFVPSKKLIKEYNSPGARASRFLGNHKSLAIGASAAALGTGGFALKRYLDKRKEQEQSA